MPIILPTPKDRILLLNKQVNQDTIGELSKQILEINDDDKYLAELHLIHGSIYKSKPINIYIDSYGGEAYQCLGMMGIMENSKTPLHTIVTGCAMSAGFFMLIAGHRRFAYRSSTLMYHQISDGVRGKLKDIEEHIMETKRLQKIVERYTLSRTKLTSTMLKSIYDKKKDWYFTVNDAIKYGVIDEII